MVYIEVKSVSKRKKWWNPLSKEVLFEIKWTDYVSKLPKSLEIYDERGEVHGREQGKNKIWQLLPGEYWFLHQEGYAPSANFWRITVDEKGGVQAEGMLGTYTFVNKNEEVVTYFHEDDLAEFREKLEQRKLVLPSRIQEVISSIPTTSEEIPGLPVIGLYVKEA